MTLPSIRPRRPLKQWNTCLQQGSVTIGFMGGSITDARPRHNWPEYVTEWLMLTYPNVRCRIENAAIGATGSDLAALRVERDMIKRNCDVVFIEYAVNDKDVPSKRRRRTQEGLVRQLLNAGITELIFVYTFSSDMKEAMEQGHYPASIAELEELASHYHIPSIWVGKHGLEQVAGGKLTMEQWLPDGLHPQEQGSRIYADCVIRYLQSELLKPDALEKANFVPEHELFVREQERNIQELESKVVKLEAFHIDHSADAWRMERMEGSLPQALKHNVIPLLPRALDSRCWEYVTELPMSELHTEGQWVEQRWHDYEWIDIMLETRQLNASLRFSFQGRGLMLVFDYGYRSAEFVYRLDDGEWIHSNRDCPEWVGAEGWLRLFDCGDDLEARQHTFELRVVEPMHERQAALGDFIFRLGKVGVIL